MMSRMHERYRKEVVPALLKRFGRKNPMSVPRVAKVTVNIGMGEASQNVKLLDVAVVELGQIAGQKPIVTRAKKSIANFKIRKGMPIGCCVTLRGDRMYEFLDRLCNVVLPRVRDFRGLPPNAFDGRGNYTMGLRDQLVFPEIDYTRVDKIKGLNITLTTTARNDEEGRELLKLLGVPMPAGRYRKELEEKRWREIRNLPRCAGSRSSRFAFATAAACAAARAATCVNFRCAASVFADTPCSGKFP